jgi:hypothetical protein
MPRNSPVSPADGPESLSLAAQELAALEELAELKARLVQIRGRGVAGYYDDPVGFVENCVKFKPGRDGKPRGLAAYQIEVIGDLPKYKRIAVRGPRGMGKSAIASLIVLWFAVTRDATGTDWKIATTAGSWQQLEDFLWPEIGKWAKALEWEKIGRAPFSERDELMKTRLRLRHGHAYAGSPDKHEKLEGLHADSVLYVYDEAKIIAGETFDSAEGAFSAAGDDSDLEAYALAISTPGEPAGRFYDIHTRKPGLEDWHTRHVTLEEAITAGRMTRSWADQRKRLWGESSALYQNHVLGEFCSDDEDAIIPLSWAEAAVTRWRAWDSAGRPEQDGPRIAGVDVARSGKDRSCIALRHGDVIVSLQTFAKADTMETCGRVKRIVDATPEMRAIIDAIGIGAGVYDRCREMGVKSEPFTGSAKATRKDRSGQISFRNLRSAAFWHIRDLLDPAANPVLALPPDDELIGDLTAIHKKDQSDGKVMAEPKDDIRKRIGRSTDKGDAVAMALWAASGGWHDAYGTMCCPSGKCGRPFMREADGKPRTHCPFCQAPLDEDEDEAA